MQEQLLGYLLDALEDPERESIEKQLERDADLREELSRVRQRLRPLEAARSRFAPPADLAKRTCQFVAQHTDSLSETPPEAQIEELPTPRSRVKAMGAERGTSGTASRWSWLDLTVAAGIVVAAALLIFPAIQDSRFHAQVTACQENLRQIGQSLTQYSDIHTGYFPYVPKQGKLAAAGSYAPMLRSAGFLENPRRVLCPGSPLAQSDDFDVPTIRQLMAMPEGEQLNRIRDTMGGTYGYSFGHLDNGRYQGTRNLHRFYFALMADAPRPNQPDYRSLNHAGRGYNVLFEDCQVRFLTTPTWNNGTDHFFTNDTGVVAAGIHLNDSVISPSGFGPIRYVNMPGAAQK